MDCERLVNLDNHPIELRRGAQYHALVDRCKEDLGARGAYVLERFLTPEAVADIRGELAHILDRAYYAPKYHNAYLAPDDPDFDERHPRNRKHLTSSATLATFVSPA